MTVNMVIYALAVLYFFTNSLQLYRICILNIFIYIFIHTFWSIKGHSSIGFDKYEGKLFTKKPYYVQNKQKYVYITITHLILGKLIPILKLTTQNWFYWTQICYLLSF